MCLIVAFIEICWLGGGLKGYLSIMRMVGGSAPKEKKERKHSFLLTVDKSSASQAVKQFYDLQFQDF